MSGRNVKDYRNEAKEISEEGTGGSRIRKGAFLFGRSENKLEGRCVICKVCARFGI